MCLNVICAVFKLRNDKMVNGTLYVYSIYIFFENFIFLYNWILTCCINFIQELSSNRCKRIDKYFFQFTLIFGSVIFLSLKREHYLQFNYCLSSRVRFITIVIFISVHRFLSKFISTQSRRYTHIIAQKIRVSLINTYVSCAQRLRN